MSLPISGIELLRSKSLDRDSYNSGDWFNAIDFTGRSNGFGRGLPPAGRNERTWFIQGPLLADARLWAAMRPLIPCDRR